MALAKVLYEILGCGVCRFGLQYPRVLKFFLWHYGVSDWDAWNILYLWELCHCYEFTILIY